MAGRLLRTLECYEYDPQLGYPRIAVKLFNVLGEESPKGKVLVPVDTGFSGSILLPRDDYEFFTIGELPRSLWRTYKTLMGTVEMRTARIFIEVTKLQGRLETVVETPLFGVGRVLIGRELLSKLKLLLDGPNRSCCHLSSSV